MKSIFGSVATLILSLMLCLPWTSAEAQPLYRLTDLGMLPGATSCAAFGINDQGAVVGYCLGTGSFDQTAFVWRDGVMTNLGKLPRGRGSAAWWINEAGVVVGEGDTGDGRPDPVLYRNGKAIDIDASGGNARAIYINDAGAIVGNYSKGFGNSNAWSAVIWTEQRPGRFDRVDLPPYPGGETKARHGYAFGANKSLQVIGYVQNTLFGQKGAFWNNDASHTLTLLEPLPGDWTSIAWGVNDLGQAVGESHPPSHTRAVLWLDDAARTPVELGMLPGDLDSVATGINNAGQIIGSSRASDGTSRPVLWENGSIVDVNALLDETGAGWTVVSVSGINNMGQMTGFAFYRGELRSFLMTPAVR